MRHAFGYFAQASARTWGIALALTMLAGGMTSTGAVAQTTPAVPASATATGPLPTLPATTMTARPANTAKATAKKTDSKLAWSSLPVPQQEALAPLCSEWAKMSDLQKEKWLEISKKYAKMKPEEQQRLHDRMRDWVKLTPAQRSAARTNYARAKKLDAEEKNEQWNKYQQLSAEQKSKLAQSKPPKRVAKLPPTPASAAPTIQLPAEALERPVAQPPALPSAPVLAPGSQATPQPVALQTAPAPTAAAGTATTAAPPVSATIAENK